MVKHIFCTYNKELSKELETKRLDIADLDLKGEQTKNLTKDLFCKFLGYL